MRELRGYSTQLLEQSRPKGSTIPVGGGDFDKFSKGEVISEFLMKLNRGSSPQIAAEESKKYALLMIKKWNSRREWQVQRWEGCLDDYIDSLKQRFDRVVNHALAK